MKTIGQFAKENEVTIKTLHHYEKMGLITPCKVDDENGYRYYSDNEANDLKLVIFLKQLGLSLSEIKKLLGNSLDSETLIEFFNTKLDQSVKDKENAIKRQHKIKTIIDTLNQNIGKIDYKELLGMSEKDLYTGKHDRGMFIEEAEKMFNQAKHNNTPLCVVELDLDHFEKINKTFGYEVGDIVLDRTQSEIISVLQEHNIKSIFERIGGDEFRIVILDTILNTSKFVSKLLNRVVEVDYSDVSEDLNVGITAGIANLRKGTETYQELASKASAQLYKDKINKRRK